MTMPTPVTITILGNEKVPDIMIMESIIPMMPG